MVEFESVEFEDEGFAVRQILEIKEVAIEAVPAPAPTPKLVVLAGYWSLVGKK